MTDQAYAYQMPLDEYESFAELWQLT